MATISFDSGRIAYRRIGQGRPLLVLNGFAATSGDWDAAFIDRLACVSELVLLDNRGIGASTDDGAPFDIKKLTEDVLQLIDTLDLGGANVLGWSMGGFIAQTLASDHPNRVHKLILLSTDPGGPDADLGPPVVRAQLTDMSGTPREQARSLLSLLFPADVAESIYREFGDIVAIARARLTPEIVHRQEVAMEAWHRNGAGDRLRELCAPTLVATGSEDIVIPASNALGTRQRHPRSVTCSISRRRPRFHGSVSTLARGSHKSIPRSL